jgi:LAO/AO transport system kinase
MATRGILGGLASATMDVALLLDAAGRQYVLIETVGVGQDEVEIARLAGTTVVVLVPGMGDDVQAIKAGLMEIADVFVINKADQPGADRLEREVQAAIGLSSRKDGWAPPIVRAVATDSKGIDEVLAAIRSYHDERNRADLWEYRLREMYRERLAERVPPGELRQAAEAVADGKRDPYTIVEEWLQEEY